MATRSSGASSTRMSRSPPRPSATDVGLAFDPEALYLLCSFASEPPEVRAWTIVEGAVNEVVLERV